MGPERINHHCQSLVSADSRRPGQSFIHVRVIFLCIEQQRVNRQRRKYIHFGFLTIWIGTLTLTLFVGLRLVLVAPFFLSDVEFNFHCQCLFRDLK